MAKKKPGTGSANAVENAVYGQTSKPKPPKKPSGGHPTSPSWAGAGGTYTGSNKPYNPQGVGTGSTNAAEAAFGIPSAPPGGVSDPYNGWDAQSLIDETLGESGWYDDGGSSGSRGGRRGGGGGGGGGGGANSAMLGELAGADAQTAALQAYLTQLQGTQGLREKPFNDAQANLASLYEMGKGTIGQAQTDVLARLQANRGGSDRAFSDYAVQQAQQNQQASGSGRAELERLLTDLRAQGLSTTALEGQANIQDAGLQQAFLRDDQRNSAQQQAMRDAFASRDSTAGMVNASALGGLEANRLNLGSQISQQQAAAMLQFQQELAQVQLQVAQQQAQADALRGTLGAAAPAATVQTPVVQTPASSSAPHPQAVASSSTPSLGDTTRNPSAPAPVPAPADRGGAIVDPALIERYIGQMARRPGIPQGPRPGEPGYVAQGDGPGASDVNAAGQWPYKPNGKRPLRISLPRGR